MDPSRRDLARALGAGLLIAATVVLIFNFKTLGIALSLALLAVMLTVLRRYDKNPELVALCTSLSITRDDICDTLAGYENLRTGLSADAIADRTLYYPALADHTHTDPTIQDFFLRAAAAQRFVSRVDAYLERGELDRNQLEKLIAVADERAEQLSVSWGQARRVARELGPN